MIRRSVTTACLGLRAKTGRAIAVVIAGGETSPRAVTRTEIRFASPAKPALFQPYHEVMDLPWERAVLEVRDAERALEVAATKQIKAFIDELRAQGIDVSRIGIVGAPERNLAAIASPHIRAHAAEGVLFRRVLQVGAEANELPSTAHSERGFETSAAETLGLSVGVLRDRLVEIGRALGSPWRADEKAAATAAWIGLAMRERAGSQIQKRKEEP